MMSLFIVTRAWDSRMQRHRKALYFVAGCFVNHIKWLES